MCGLIICLGAAVCLAGCSDDGGPDLIFHGGPILTVDAGDRIAEAVAVRDGVITAVGSASEVLAARTTRTEVRDLDGRALLPGFVAAHEHPTLAALLSGVVDLSGFSHQTNTEVWDALREAVAATPPGEWIFATGIDPILVPDLQMPTRRTLDAIAPHHPVLIVSQTMHSFWANSLAFAEAGITRDTPDPGYGSFYERDADGELTGFIAENAAAAPLLAPLRSPWRIAHRYGQELDKLLDAGFTSVASLGYNVPPLLARWAASFRLRPRIRQFFYLTENELDELPDRPDLSDPFFRIQGIKLWNDGSPYTGSMYLEEPYLDSPLARSLGIVAHSRGMPMLTPEHLTAMLRRSAAGGWQVAIHSQGDASSLAVAHAFAAVPDPRTAVPRRLEHGVLLPLAVLPEFARLGVSPSFHINHIYYYGDALADAILGPERAACLLPVRSAFELGMRPTLHADSPMFPAAPFSLMKTAILRRSRSGRVYGADQAIDARQALRAMTANGAYQLGVEPTLGSIEVGKWADLQVVSANPYVVPAERFEQIRVLEVYVHGRRVGSRAP